MVLSHEHLQAHSIPLVESVLAFQFERTNQWNSDFFESLHSLIRADFPRTERQAQHQIHFAEGKPVEISADIELRRYLREDGGVIVTIGPATIGVSIVARECKGGYPGWERLRDTALTVFEHYRNITSPGRVLQVGVRYINAIRIAEDTFRLADFVDPSSGMIPAKLLDETSPFVFRLERQRGSTPAEAWREVVSLYATSHVNGYPELVFDVDELFLPLSSGAAEDVSRIAERLHDLSGESFLQIMSARFRTGGAGQLTASGEKQ